MDSKTKYKILGVFVAIGLVVILYPFFQSGDEVPSVSAQVTPPAFPEQTTQVVADAAPVATSDSVVSAEPVAQPATDEPAPVADNTNSAATNEPQAEQVEAASSANNDVKSTPDDTVQNVHSDSTPEAPAIPVDAAPAPKKSLKSAAIHKKKLVKPVALVKQLVIQSYKSQLKQEPLTDDGLFQLKNAAWVVQLGSFNNKTNALKLVNQLRASGYRAFIQKVATNDGANTRVFVGPESKPEAARSLANQLEDNLHLRGIIISYKPLKL